MFKLSAQALKSLGLEPGDTFIEIGSKKLKERVVKDERLEADKFHLIWSSPEEVKIFNFRQSVCFYHKGNQNIKIGPILGIMISRPVMLEEQEIIDLYKTISDTAYKEGVICYFFTPDYIDFANEVIVAYQYDMNRSKGWVMQNFPLPDVVYNQVGSLSENLKANYRKFFSEYVSEDSTLKLINDFGLANKLVNYQRLKEYKSIKEFLPETKICNSADILLDFCNKYGEAILKPTSSSLGKGVMKLKQMNDNEFILSFNSKEKGLIERKYNEISQLKKDIKGVILSRPYLVQQSIDLVVFDERPVDFRVHLFKNEEGKWDLLLNKAKIGPKGGVVTGRMWGGYHKAPALEVLRESFSRKMAEEIDYRINATAVKIAGKIDELFPGKFGELGFDIAVDREGKVWMLEVNPKPNWAVPLGADKEKLEQDLADHLIGYTRYLLGLSKCRYKTLIPGDLFLKKRI